MRRVLCWVCGAALAVALLVPAAASAQQPRQVTGRVTDAATGQPIAGVQIVVQGTTIGTVTDGAGNYQITVPAGRNVLVFSFIGYRTVEQEITGDGPINVAMEIEVIGLEGVVVTALGIERQARTMGVAAQTISGNQLPSLESNLVNTLTGRVAGVNITNAGPQGGSSRIVIRGAKSITGNNQPLIVVDGIPVDNSSPRLQGYGGFDYGNAIQDVSPENIQSITVLKGPTAAALYGSRASNGAVLITTKSGRGVGQGGQWTFNQQVSFETPLRLPDFQNEYGQGYNSRFAYVDGKGSGVFDEVDESWGPPLDGRLIPQFNSPIDPETGERIPTPWLPNPDNVRNFFETGITKTTNVAFAVATDRANARISGSRMIMDGMVPGFGLRRTTLALNGGLQVSDRLSTDASVQFIASDGNNRPGIGYGESNPMIQFIWFGRQVDVEDLKRNWNTRRGDDDPQAGMPYSWNYSYHPNPYYLQLANRNEDERNRIIGNVSATYRVAPWLSAMVRIGTDWYADNRRYNYADGLWGTDGFDPLSAGDAATVGKNGAFGRWGIDFQETNSDFLLTATPPVELPFSLTATLGASRRDVVRTQEYLWVAELLTPGVYSLDNAAVQPQASAYTSRKRINSVYGQLDFGFRDYLFVSVTGRNDWSSTLPENNNSYFYPSVSTSFVFSDAIPSLQNSSFLSYGKLRAAWARVGNDTDPYRLRSTFSAGDPFLGYTTYSVPNTLANADLKPEMTTSKEFGVELGFLNDRLGLDVTYFDELTEDQIMSVQISRATGYSGRYVNAGSMRNRGIEVLLRGVPVQTDNFRWETSLTFDKTKNEVVSLAEGLDGLQLGSYWYARVYARPGEPYGQILGTTFQRDPQGRIIVNANGVPLRSQEMQVLGNYNPDWSAGWSNTLRYKDFSLSFLFDTKQGGELYSVTHQWGTYAGVLKETVKGRCIEPGWDPVDGMPECTPETGIVVPGVVRVISGTDTTYVENTKAISAQTYWSALGNIAEAHIVDASYIKLRDVTFTWNVPASITSRLGFSGMQLSVSGRNLLLWTDAPHIDPETAFDASNVQGFEFGQLPTPRSFGFGLTIQP